jgi:FixJ family two-component response regulator
MSTSEAMVFVVDDDASVRKLIASMLALPGYSVKTFASAQELLLVHHRQPCQCLILDVQLPGLNGLELQQALMHAGEAPPIVFITGHGDIPKTVQAMKAGAVDFLQKPLTEESLLNAVQLALDRGLREQAVKSELAEIEERLATLTARETEVLRHVTAGRLNKQIAADLGIAEKTVKVHRSRVMRKLRVQSVAELVRLVVKARFGGLDQA